MLCQIFSCPGSEHWEAVQKLAEELPKFNEITEPPIEQALVKSFKSAKQGADDVQFAVDGAKDVLKLVTDLKPQLHRYCAKRKVRLLADELRAELVIQHLFGHQLERAKRGGRTLSYADKKELDVFESKFEKAKQQMQYMGNICTDLVSRVGSAEEKARAATMQIARAQRLGLVAANAVQQASLSTVLNASHDAKFWPHVQKEEGYGEEGEECHMECAHVNAEDTWPPKAQDDYSFL